VYPAKSTTATLKITSFLMAKRKQPTSKKESLEPYGLSKR